MSGLQGRIADAAEEYFHALEDDGYRPEGCNGDELAKHLVESASWDLLMAIIERHYPEDIFPTMEDREDRDLGPRVISLIRRLNQAVAHGDTP